MVIKLANLQFTELFISQFIFGKDFEINSLDSVKLASMLLSKRIRKKVLIRSTLLSFYREISYLVYVGFRRSRSI